MGSAGSNGQRDGLQLRQVGRKETVTLRWGSTSGKVLVTTTSNGMGSVGVTAAVTFTVPASAPGSYRVYAIGKQTRATTFALFKVT